MEETSRLDRLLSDILQNLNQVLLLTAEGRRERVRGGSEGRECGEGVRGGSEGRGVWGGSVGRE